MKAFHAFTLIASFLLLGVVVRSTLAQLSSGSILGTVTDASGTVGTAGRNILIGLGVLLWDFSVQKNFRMREGQQLQPRFDWLSFLNHPNFNTPVAVPNATNFGTIATAQESGQMQLGLRYSF